MSRVLRFSQASARERSVLVRSFIWIALYRIGLWVLPFSVTRRWALGQVETNSKVNDEQMVTEIIRSVRFASKFVPHASCLTQALAARKLLGECGQSAELKFGVTKSDGNFEAHAWLEMDGRIVLGKQRMHSRYAVLGSNQIVPR